MPDACAQKKPDRVSWAQISLAYPKTQIDTKGKKKQDKDEVGKVDQLFWEGCQKIVAKAQTDPQQAGCQETGKKQRRCHRNSFCSRFPAGRGSS